MKIKTKLIFKDFLKSPLLEHVCRRVQLTSQNGKKPL